MKKTTVTKEDGRYLIFYTFEDDLDMPPSATDSEKQAEYQSNEDTSIGNDD